MSTNSPAAVPKSSSPSSYVVDSPPQQPVLQHEKEEEPLWGPLLMELVGEDPAILEDVSVTSLAQEVDDYDDQTTTVDDNNEQVTSGGVSSGSSVVVDGRIVRKRNGRGLFTTSSRSKKGRSLESYDRNGGNSRRPSPAPKPEVAPSPTRGLPWTEQEHRMFLWGLQSLGKGDWKTISRDFVPTRSPTQVASHAQKFYVRHSQRSSECKRHRRPSIHDITSVNDPSPFATHHFYNPPPPPPPQQSSSTATSNLFYDDVLALYSRNDKKNNKNTSFQTPVFVQIHRRHDHDQKQLGEDEGFAGGLPLSKSAGDIDPYVKYDDCYLMQQQEQQHDHIGSRYMNRILGDKSSDF